MIEEKAMRHRKNELYKLANEIMNQKLMIATLSKIAFINYMLELDLMENKRLESMINVVNSNRGTNHQLTDFYIRFWSKNVRKYKYKIMNVRKVFLNFYGYVKQLILIISNTFVKVYFYEPVSLHFMDKINSQKGNYI